MREIKLLSEPDLDTFPRNHSGNLLSPVYDECNIQGIGIMYRVINVPWLIAVLSDHNFNGQSCRLKLTISMVWPRFPKNATWT